MRPSYIYITGVNKKNSNVYIRNREENPYKCKKIGDFIPPFGPFRPHIQSVCHCSSTSPAHPVRFHTHTRKTTTHFDRSKCEKGVQTLKLTLL